MPFGARDLSDRFLDLLIGYSYNKMHTNNVILKYHPRKTQCC